MKQFILCYQYYWYYWRSTLNDSTKFKKPFLYYMQIIIFDKGLQTLFFLKKKTLLYIGYTPFLKFCPSLYSLFLFFPWLIVWLCHIQSVIGSNISFLITHLHLQTLSIVIPEVPCSAVCATKCSVNWRFCTWVLLVTLVLIALW